MKIILSVTSGILFLACLMRMAVAQPDSASPSTGWHLVWSDEFDQPDGSAPDTNHWSFDTGGNGWGNNELEYYTSSTNNAHIEKGKLVIEARRESFGKREYTSARLLTAGKFSCAYGRFEARIKLPAGQGMWPAFWLLGTNIASVNWPTCGEIDIMENVGKEPGTVHGTIHGPGYSGGKGIGGPVMVPDGRTLTEDFHVFAVECEPGRITWFMDEKPYFSVTPASLPKNTRWVFDEPKFLILNLAVGGDWPGNPDVTSTFPQRMIIDYVRVYEKALTLQRRN